MSMTTTSNIAELAACNVGTNMNNQMGHLLHWRSSMGPGYKHSGARAGFTPPASGCLLCLAHTDPYAARTNPSGQWHTVHGTCLQAVCLPRYADPLHHNTEHVTDFPEISTETPRHWILLGERVRSVACSFTTLHTCMACCRHVLSPSISCHSMSASYALHAFNQEQSIILQHYLSHRCAIQGCQPW